MQKHDGFTLIEVLVAITILGVISVLVWQASGTLLASKERFEAQDEAFESGMLALQQITRDLEGAFIYQSPDFLGRSGSGEQRTKTVFIGADEGDQDRVVFHSMTHVRYLKDSKESDQAEVSYFLEADPETSGLFILKKRESSPPDAEPEQGGEGLSLLYGVKELNFRYFDKQRAEFFDSWDSTKMDNLNKIPRAISILLILQDPSSEEGRLRFQTTAFPGLAPGPNDF